VLIRPRLSDQLFSSSEERPQWKGRCSQTILEMGIFHLRLWYSGFLWFSPFLAAASTFSALSASNSARQDRLDSQETRLIDVERLHTDLEHPLDTVLPGSPSQSRAGKQCHKLKRVPNVMLASYGQPSHTGVRSA
jgi:hypothetical protein